MVTLSILAALPILHEEGAVLQAFSPVWELLKSHE